MRIDLSKADDPRDVVHQAVASLAQGRPIALAADGVHGVVASALRPDAVWWNRKPEVAEADGPITLLLKAGSEVPDWISSFSSLSERISRRGWPGPLTLLYPAPSRTTLYDRLPEPVRELFLNDEMAVQVPGHPFVRDVLRLVPGPVVLTPFSHLQGTTSNWESLGEATGLDMLIDAGPTRKEASLVRIHDESMTVVRAGAVDEAHLTRLAATLILFVCTGNTCRSPMAEGICKILLAERVGCRIDELEEQGYLVMSAGIAAVSGMPAAANAIDVIQARGGSLREHVSRKLTLDLVRQSDLILTMTSDHLETLLEHVPDAAPRTRPLHPHGDDVADPVGADRDTYQRTAEAIESYLVSMLDTLGI